MFLFVISGGIIMLKFYFEQLGLNNIPKFLIKYLETPSLVRLKKVGYFCGMDYASKDVYNFSEYISRFDHSLSVALLTYKLTNDKRATIAGLLHDISTPCFSHVIDYMNKDYEKQESTEEYTEKIIRKDKRLLDCLKMDGIRVDDIVDFKQFTVVDNNRPKLCADRIDGIVLTGIGWTKNITQEDIKNIVSSLSLFRNEFGETEIGFDNLEVLNKVVEINRSIDIYCHSKEDNYMMHLLSDITKLAIENNYITYEDLYSYNEEELFRYLKLQDNIELKEMIYKFENLKTDEIPDMEMPNIKVRALNPMIDGKRVSRKSYS